MIFRVNKEMADFGFANFGDDDENEEEEFTFQVNEICINLINDSTYRELYEKTLILETILFFILSIHVNI